MCGRYVLRDPVRAARVLGGQELAAAVASLPPRFNIAPTQAAAVFEREAAANGARGGSGSDGKGGWTLDLKRWGLIPNWMKPKPVPGDPKRQVPAGWFNARAETVSSKPAFRGAFRHRRCVVPADGFYEWRNEGGARRPHVFRVAGDSEAGDPFYLAGIHETWCPPCGSELPTVSVLTTVPNELLAAFHDRMPVMLDAAAAAVWAGTDPDAALAVARPFPAERMWSAPVDPRVGRPTIDEPGLLDPPADGLAGGNEQASLFAE